MTDNIENQDDTENNEVDGVNPFLTSEETAKKQLKNTIETYKPNWRALLEKLQNAIDSFLLESEDKLVWGNFGEGHVAKVTITFDLVNNLIIVEDNGTGMDVKNYSYFIQLGTSGKDSSLEEVNDTPTKSINRRKVKGSQGVGVKSSVFSSSYFKVESVYKNENDDKLCRWEMELHDWSKFTEKTGSELTVPMPQVEEIDDSETTGTKVSVNLDPDLKPMLDADMEMFTVRGFLNWMLLEQISALQIDFDNTKNPPGTPECITGYTYDPNENICKSDTDDSVQQPDIIGTWTRTGGSGIKLLPILKSKDLLIDYLRTQTYVGDLTRPLDRYQILSLEEEITRLQVTVNDLKIGKVTVIGRKQILLDEGHEESSSEVTELIEEIEKITSELTKQNSLISALEEEKLQKESDQLKDIILQIKIVKEELV
jgi:hypothetical protein